MLRLFIILMASNVFYCNVRLHNTLNSWKREMTEKDNERQFSEDFRLVPKQDFLFFFFTDLQQLQLEEYSFVRTFFFYYPAPLRCYYASSHKSNDERQLRGSALPIGTLGSKVRPERNKKGDLFDRQK